MKPVRRAVFLDKDGTLVENMPYNIDPARVQLSPGGGEAVRALHAAGYVLVVVSNQSGVARGLFPAEALATVAERLRELLADHGVPLVGFYFCPHHPSGTQAEYAVPCTCRKPEPGMILRAADEHAIDLSRSWVIGDATSDVEAGRRAGCRTIQLVGVSRPESNTSLSAADFMAESLADAARIVLAER